MSCYHPITVYRSKAGRSETGSWPIVFKRAEGMLNLQMQIPCGRCIGCRLEKTRQWAIRCVHESKTHDKNCFITLTFNDENLDKEGSLNKRDYVLFMKKLRKEFGPKIRFFHCGEYGENMGRPHHHAIIFNFDFEDKYLYRLPSGKEILRSDSLERIWKNGFCTVGEATFESAAYVASYVTKKITGPKAAEHYKGRQPEYVTMSRRPGIGQKWIEKYHDDVYKTDQMVVREKYVTRAPRYYDSYSKNKYPEQFSKTKKERFEKSLKKTEIEFMRMSQKEQCAIEKFKKKERQL